MTLLNSRVGKILGSFDVNIGEIQVIESEPERARDGQSEPDSEPERLASHLKHASTLFCYKTDK